MNPYQVFLAALCVCGAVQGALLLYLFGGPTDVQAYGFEPGKSPDLTGNYVSNDALSVGKLIPMRFIEDGKVEMNRYRGVGPEHVAVHPTNGYVYTGLCDAGLDQRDEPAHCRLNGPTQGWIVRFRPEEPRKIERYVRTGGRPLGMEFDAQGRLYVADAIRGLLRITDLPPGPSEDTAEEEERPRIPRVEKIATCRIKETFSSTAEEKRRRKGLHPDRKVLPLSAEDLRGSDRRFGADRAYPPTAGESQEESQHALSLLDQALPRKELSPPRDTLITNDDDDAHWDLADSVVLSQDGRSLWYSCPTTKFPLSRVREEGLQGGPDGRIFRYDICEAENPLSCPIKLIADRLMFPNGLALRERGDEMTLFINEWSRFAVTRIDLNSAGEIDGFAPLYSADAVGTQRPAAYKTVIEGLPGYPDNITIDGDTLWVALVIRRNPLVDRLRPYPFFLNILSRLPESWIHFNRHAWLLGIDEDGKVTHNLQDTTGFFNQVTGAYPIGDALYLTSNTDPALLCIPHPEKPDTEDPCHLEVHHHRTKTPTSTDHAQDLKSADPSPQEGIEL